jgi:hypothetical protein
VRADELGRGQAADRQPPVVDPGRVGEKCEHGPILPVERTVRDRRKKNHDAGDESLDRTGQAGDETGADLRDAAVMLARRKTIASVLLFGVLPIAVLSSAGYYYDQDGTLGADFRGELYPAAHLLVHGANPFSSPSIGPLAAANRIFPVPADALAVPFTVFGPRVASIVLAVVLLGCLALMLRVAGVTDWRVYGVVALWPSSIAAIQTGNPSIVVALLLAVAVRFGDRRFLPGLAVGGAVAVKLFPWPMIVWLAAGRRYAAALVATAISIATVLLALPFISLTGYARLMRNLGDAFAPASYNVVGLLYETGAVGLIGVRAAEAVALPIGLVILALAYRRRSLPLSIAACLALSPIVWTHFLVILAIPLAARWPSFSPAWLIPLGLVVCPGGGSSAAWQTVVGILVIVAVTVVTELHPGSDPSRQEGSDRDLRARIDTRPLGAASGGGGGVQ